MTRAEAATRRWAGAASRLERRCRLLLLAYPPRYRSERGEEILTTLLDAAPAGRRWPDLADAADIVAAGLRRRLGTASLAGLDGGLALAAPVALALAAGIAGFAWWRVEPVATDVYIGSSFGAFRTLGPVCYACWLLAAAGWTMCRPALRRVLIGVAVAATLATPLLAAVSGVDRPPLWMLFAMAAFGLIALAGSGPMSGRARSTLDARLAVPAGAVAVAVGASTVVRLWHPSRPGVGYYYQPTVARVGTVVTAAVAVVAVVAIVRQARRQPYAEWLWASAVLALPAGWMGPFDSTALRAAAAGPAPHFGRLAQVVLASCVAASTLAWLARRRQASRADRGSDPLLRSGAIAVGAATGLTLFAVAGRAGWLAFVDTAASSGVPAHVPAAVLCLGVAGLAAVRAASSRTAGSTGRAGTAGPTAPAGPGGAGGHSVPKARRAIGPVLGSGVLTAASAWLVAAYDNGWTLRGWPDLGHTLSLVVTLALVPLSACAHAAAMFLAGGCARTTRTGALVVLAASLGWIGFAALPYVLSWGPVPFVLVLAGVATALSRPLIRTHRALPPP